MANFTKFFRNGNTFSAYCRMRYGQSKKIWDDTSLWQRSGKFAIAFDQEAADTKFNAASVKTKPEADGYDEFRGLRKMENMMDYIHSGCGLDAYYEDQAAGYVE